MKRALFYIVILLLIVNLSGCKQKPADDSNTKGAAFNENIRPTEPRTPEQELSGFIVPDGFEITLFASEPDIDKPMNLTFDAKGRMWVTQSFEYPFPTAPGLKSTDKLTIVEDTDNDGKADKFTVVSDTMNIPIGILPTADGAISFSVPNLYKLTDADRDDIPESKRRMFGPFGYQDTHGMVSNFIRGYDGWVHACHGYTNLSAFAGADGDTIRLVSGNTFRFRMDGSRVEQLTFGQVNPFGLVFDLYGYVYSTDSHSSPLYQLIRGGDYPHFGKVPIMGFGPDMKSLVDEATALAGITQYADVQFPEEFRGNFFIGDVVNSRVHRYSATWKGSSPVGKSEVDFIKSEDPWFRPVNIKLGPDGALYVADFYNAIIGHYEVPLNHPKRDKHRGRIWRITYKGKKNDKVDLSKMSAEELIKKLDADNLPVRVAATDQITDRVGSAAVEVLKSTLADANTTGRQYVHSMWALFRLNALSDETLRASIGHKDSLIRIHALRVLVEKAPDPSFYDLISASLTDNSPHVQRVATELLMKYPSTRSLEAALGILHKTKVESDNHLFYTARLVLRNILRNDAVLQEAVAKTWDETDAGYIAGVMVDVPLPSAATFLSGYMSQYSLPPDKVPSAYRQIARFTPIAQLQSVVDRALGAEQTDLNQRSLIYKGMLEGLVQRGGKTDTKLFAKWAPALATELFKKYPGSDLTDSDEKYTHQTIAIGIAGDHKVKSLEPDLKLFLAQGHKIGWTIRGSALRSLMKIDLENARIGADILANDTVIEFQRRIGAVMGEFPGKTLNKVLDEVTSIPPGLQDVVVVALAGSPEGKDIIIKKVRRGEILPRTLAQPRTEELVMMNASKQQQREFEELTADLGPIREEKQAVIEKRLAAFESLDRKKISLDSGALVFEQNCGVCHKLGGQMGVGPQLDGIGKTGARGLIEKILDPNRNISAAFKSYTIKLKDGTVKSGLFRRDEGASKVFADLTGKEFTVANKDIEEQKLSKYTLMPDSFESTIDQKDFNLLVNYLLTL
ncbi:MAG TPA: PVC-type heme-binding CxxCH protein [Cyclobacteriaceae bacterium]|nr:PVC-type heme-binding CxxCH protein [Cyclobacteriaceae bacterium]